MRIAWCCKWLPPKKSDSAAAEAMNLRGTTAAALMRLTPAAAAAKLLDLVRANLAALHAQIAATAARPPIERALRIGSELPPLYTHPAARPYYAAPAARDSRTWPGRGWGAGTRHRGAPFHASGPVHRAGDGERGHAAGHN